MTTAERIAQYRKELVTGGFDYDDAVRMATEAARLVISTEGLTVTVTA